MKNLLICTAVFATILLACTRKQEQKSQNTFDPKSIETTGYVVPKDSMTEPRVILIDESKPIKTPAYKLAMIPANTNVYVAGIPKIILAGIPRLITPGTDTFPLPKIAPAIEKPFIAGIPEVITAKYAQIKDNNPQNFCSFSKLQGLKHDVIRCMLQDNDGNLWFGTYGGGVSKYDGKSFTNFTEKEGLANNTVLSILQDKSENIWIGTYSGGVSKYDGNTFTNFAGKEGFSNNSVRSIIQDKNGNLWFGTEGGGLLKYDGKSFTHFTEKEGLSNNMVSTILQDRNGNIWIGTDGGGVSKYDGKSFANFTEKEGLSNNKILKIIQDKRGNIWFGTDGGGVLKYDGKTFTNFTEKEGLSNNVVWSILEDKSGNLWFGTYSGGISKYDGKYFTRFTENEGLSKNFVWSMLEDKSGNLWFGTYGGGVSKFNGKIFTNFTEKEGLPNNLILSSIQDKNGNLWFGTYDGSITKYDGKSFTSYSEKENLSNNSVRAILEDKNGNFWFGTDGGGVMKYDGKTFIHFAEKEGLLNNQVMSILEDRLGNIWFGTYDGGVSKYDGKSFTNFTKKEGLSNNRVVSILQDKRGNLWFGTDGGGVTMLSEDGKTFTHFTQKEGLSNNRVWSIVQDKNENLWFGTFGGVSRLSKNLKSITRFTAKDGLSNDFIFSMYQDKKGNLWFGTRFGLDKLSANNHLKLDEILDKSKSVSGDSGVKEKEVYFKNYDYEDGFLGIGVNGGKTICEDKNGTIWIGSNDRLIAYHSEGDKPDTISPNLQLTNIELYNEKVEWINLTDSRKGNNPIVAKDTAITLRNGAVIHDFEFDGITKWYGLPGKLSLAYNNNYLTFIYIGITQLQSQKVKYKYKLEGFDKNWSAVTNRTEAPYGNLPSGTYTFKVKAVNSEGYWSNELSYHFTIRPPWWGTLGFRIGMWLLIITCLLSLYYWRVASLKKQRKQLEIVVMEKTIEVVKQKDEILIQKDELEIANATKDKFFGIIAHDLKSPFNSIIGFSRLLSQQVKDRDLEGVDEYANIIIDSSNRAMDLLTNLMEWAQSQTGKITFKPEYFEMVDFINDILPIFNDIARSKSIIIKNNLPDSLLVYADKAMISTVFRNLISNAVKFTKHGGEIIIFAERRQNEIIVSVSDNGVGIVKSRINKIFRLDEVYSTAGTDEEKGTGLGLILCKEFVEKHEGKIWIESEVGIGSTIYFTLPFSFIIKNQMPLSGQLH